MDLFGIYMYCKQLLKEAMIDIEEIAVSSIPDDPICDSERITVDVFLIRIWPVVYL